MLSDFHLHSSNSDGTNSVDEVITQTKQGKTKRPLYLSFTDHHYQTHNLVINIKNLCIIPGIEIATETQNGLSIHLTAYSSSPKTNTEYKKLLASIRNGYQHRADKIYQKITSYGYQLPKLSEIRKIQPPPIYTYDFAALLKKQLGLPTDYEVIKWSKNNGNLFFVEETPFLPRPEYVTDLLTKLNYHVFWAHPGTRFATDNTDQNTFIDLLKNLLLKGLKGIECYFPKHTQVQTNFFCACTKKYDLLASGGTDYHGSGRGPNFPLIDIPSNHIFKFTKLLGLS